VVGYYSLGYMLANLLLTFIPLALHTLFTSAFAEAYGKHPGSLGRLVAGMYQIILVICLPLCLLGAFFAPQAVIVIYGGKMAAAGPIASFFCLFQVLTLVWIPLSIALTATEKVAKTMWLNFLQLAINLGLDYFLIKYYGVAGALIAVILTYLVTAPVKFWVIGGLLGGIYFPWSFALRIGLPALFLAGIFYFFLPPLGLLGLIIMSAAYLVTWILALKLFGLICCEDTQQFRLVGLAKLNRAIDFFIS